MINASKNSGKKHKFIFDGYAHKTVESFIKFTEKFGLPNFILFLDIELDTFKKRFTDQGEEGPTEFTDENLEKYQKDNKSDNSRK